MSVFSGYDPQGPEFGDYIIVDIVSNNLCIQMNFVVGGPHNLDVMKFGSVPAVSSPGSEIGKIAVRCFPGFLVRIAETDMREV